jgi:hypothetical protein
MSCLFCGRKKDSRPRWMSDIIITTFHSTHDPMRTLTVCPECRKNFTISQLYDKSLQIQLAEIKNVMEKYDKYRTTYVKQLTKEVASNLTQQTTEVTK